MEFTRLRPMSVTEVLDGAFTLYRHHFTTLVVTALIPMLPVLILYPISSPLAQVAHFLGGMFVAAAMVHDASEGVLGRQPRIGDGLQSAARRFVPVVLNMFLYGLMLVVGFLALVIPGICL